MLGWNIRNIFKIIMNIPITTAQKTITAKVKNVLNALSIYLFIRQRQNHLINKYSIAIAQIDVISLTKIILYFVLFYKQKSL